MHKHIKALGLPILIVVLTFLMETASIAGSGEELYFQNCATCHGPDGEGAMPGVPDLSVSPSALDKEDTILIFSILNGLERPDAELTMPPLGGADELSNTEAAAILEYMRNAF